VYSIPTLRLYGPAQAFTALMYWVGIGSIPWRGMRGRCWGVTEATAGYSAVKVLRTWSPSGLLILVLLVSAPAALLGPPRGGKSMIRAKISEIGGHFPPAVVVC